MTYDEFDDPEYLRSEHLKLKEEVAELQCDIKPLRQRYLQLQSDILTHHKALSIDEEESIMNTYSITQAVTLGDFSSAMIKFKSENEALKSQVARTKQLFSHSSIRFLKHEVQSGQGHALSLASNIAETERELERVRSDIDTYKVSTMYEEVQNQKEKIYQLLAKLDHAHQLHSQLKADHYLLTHSSTEEVADEVATVTRLSRKLAKVRRRHCEKCELLIAVRDKQMKEIEEVGAALGTAYAKAEEVSVPEHDEDDFMPKRFLLFPMSKK